MSYVMALRELVGTRPLILPGTSVLVLDADDRLLLMERADTGGWGLPGGFMEPGESFEETGRREVAEETGLILGALDFVGVFSGSEYYYRYPHGDEVFNVTAVYSARLVPGTAPAVSDPSEARALRFFPLGKLPADVISPEVPIVELFRARYTGALGGTRE